MQHCVSRRIQFKKPQLSCRYMLVSLLHEIFGSVQALRAVLPANFVTLVQKFADATIPSKIRVLAYL